MPALHGNTFAQTVISPAPLPLAGRQRHRKKAEIEKKKKKPKETSVRDNAIERKGTISVLSQICGTLYIYTQWVYVYNARGYADKDLRVYTRIPTHTYTPAHLGLRKPPISFTLDFASIGSAAAASMYIRIYRRL